MGRLSHLLTADPAAINPGHAALERVAANKERFRMQKRHADRRGIPFLFTLESWLAWWEATGHFDERGRLSDNYVMGRFGDAGAYETGNVKCIRVTENISEAHRGRKHTDAARANMRKSRRERP